MSFFQSLILGIIQGLTEFLPVSSSAHLVLVPYILDWDIPESQVFPFDVLVQIGTLLAVIFYFRKDLWSVITGFVRALVRKKPFETNEARLGWYLIIATIPAGLAGVLLKDRVEAAFNNPRLTAIFLFVTALFLLASEFFGRRNRKLEQMTWLDALIAGIFQAFSIFPGISRSGSTITGGMLRHMERPAAARFAFLMAIPVMLAAGIFSIPDLLDVPNLSTFLPVLSVGFLTAALVGYFSIHWLLAFLNKRSLVYFAAYCVLLASAVLIISNIRSERTGAPTDSVEGISQTGQVSTPINVILQVNHNPATDWLIPAASECAAELPELAMVTDVESPLDRVKSLTTVDFYWGEPVPLPDFATVLAEEQLVFIVNPENPLNNLPLVQLSEILEGKLVNWGDLQESCPSCYTKPLDADLKDTKIQLMSYPEGSDAQVEFTSNFSVSSHIKNSMMIVPSTSAMNQEVLSDRTALGYIPAQAASESVTRVKLTDQGKNIEVSSPLLAVTTTEPQGVFRQWLACLQQEITP